MSLLWQTDVNQFFGDCERAFRFLETEHGFRYKSGIRRGAALRRDDLAPWRESEAPGEQDEACTLYEHDDIVLEFTLSASGYAARALYGRVYVVPLEKLLHGVGKAGAPSEFAPVLRHDLPNILKPDPAILESAIRATEKELEKAIRTKAAGARSWGQWVKETIGA